MFSSIFRTMANVTRFFMRSVVMVAAAVGAYIVIKLLWKLLVHVDKVSGPW